jgi:hypothetical protein
MIACWRHCRAREDVLGPVRHVLMPVALALLAAGCTTQGTHPATRAPVPARDPHTTAALLKVATVFNHDYDTGDYGPVWDRWDARSQEIITRADYIARHTECPDSPQSVTVEDASSGQDGAMIVDYETGGVQLRDYWFYAHGRWVFDLPLSNPDSVRLYKLTPQQYLSQLGCAH